MNIIITEQEQKPEIQEEQLVELTVPEVSEEDRRAAIDAKVEARRAAKADVKRKFRIGDEYWIKIGASKKTFKLVKYVYTIGPNPVSSLVMVQTGGPETNTYTLNEHDCRRLHLKYQPGLQVFSMKLKWNRIKSK